VRREGLPPPLAKRGTKLQIDRERRTILVDGREVHLTPLECKLLLALAKSRAKSMTEKQLLTAVWGARATPDAPYLRAQVRHLRQKIETDPSRPRHLVSGPGGGYRLKLS
jgi:two-component system KDP operon response regulator KdpE